MCSCRFSYLCVAEVCDVWCSLVKGRVRSLRVVELNPVINDPFCLESVSNFMQVDGLLFQRPPQPLNKDIVEVSPLPSIDIFMSALVKVVIHPAPLYWLPWSVFIIAGLPYRAIASSNASTQKLASNVLESHQVKTLRVAQSMIATRYRKPFLTGM